MAVEKTRRQKLDNDNSGNFTMKFYSPEKEPVNLSARKQMTILTGIKYAFFGILLILLFVTGSRFIGDNVISAMYPNRFYPWFGFGSILFLLISIILFPIDYYKDFILGKKSGLHSMTWIDIVGRWARRVFIDAVSFGFISYIMFLGYFDRFIWDAVRIAKHADYIATSGLFGYLLRLTIPILVFGIVLIPVWLWLKDTLLFFTSYGFRSTKRFDENVAKVKLLGKRYGCTILGTYYYHLSGDHTTETKLVGFFGLYFVFLPGTLSGKSALVASASKAFANAKGMHGTIKNIVNWVVFGIGIFLSMYGFHLSYKILYPRLTWPSETAFTADPSLVMWIMFFMGLAFLLATFINNNLGKILDKSSDRIAEKNGFERLDGYKRHRELSMGFDDKREPLTDLFLIDKAKHEIFQ
ncbi:MAG: hypothetical protein R2883_01900 [Caldisericia bacterium]